MQFIGVDLGSTNIKAAVYDQQLSCIAMESIPVSYLKNDGFVEFDAEAYVSALKNVLHRVVEQKSVVPHEINTITFTGQAESLVILDAQRKPLVPVISWMDERSVNECVELKQHFSQKDCSAKTGQLAILPTWPATKVLWLRHNRPDVYAAAVHYLLLKDYIVFRFTGKLAADLSIATFSFYTDIYQKCYWQEMLDVCGIRLDQLPPLVEPCSVIGSVIPAVASAIGISEHTVVNIGTLDHFAGMVGTGNVQPGEMSLSTGTVMALATMAADPVGKDTGIAMHYGFQPNTYVTLLVAESGGICLEWFKRACMPSTSYDALNEELAKRPTSDVVFLPYLVGTNAPDFNSNACGMFFGLRDRHDRFDMAYAIMEGVAHLLKVNSDRIAETGTLIHHIVATGGGSKSDIWCQLQADITGIPVCIPLQKEAACLGAAMIGAVSAGAYADLSAVCDAVVRMEKTFLPHENPLLSRKHRQYLALYEAMCRVQELS
ncbi:MAG: FGGY family carbohydrate kinase [Clostridia bacterium]